MQKQEPEFGAEGHRVRITHHPNCHESHFSRRVDLMNLFGDNPTANLLPRDGTVNYHGVILPVSEAWACFDALLKEVPWRHDEAVLYGKRIVTAREVAWYGDSAYEYTYSGTTKTALPWSAELRRLKHTVEQACGAVFNSCLLNLYHHGGEGMAWHSDDEKSLGRNTTIASVSLGTERKFSLRHKRDHRETVSIRLEHGSLLVMKGETQTHWQHTIPKSAAIKEPRINLTFRTIVTPLAERGG